MSKMNRPLDIRIVDRFTDLVNCLKFTMDKFNQDLAYATYRYNIQYSSDLDVIEGRDV